MLFYSKILIKHISEQKKNLSIIVYILYISNPKVFTAPSLHPHRPNLPNNGSSFNRPRRQIAFLPGPRHRSLSAPSLAIPARSARSKGARVPRPPRKHPITRCLSKVASFGARNRALIERSKLRARLPVKAVWKGCPRSRRFSQSHTPGLFIPPVFPHRADEVARGIRRLCGKS